jgi:hypothetical protein
MYCRRGDLEIALYIRLRRSVTVELGVVENERKVLPLFWRVALYHPWSLCRLTCEVHYSRRTEVAYAHWIKRFIIWSGRRHFQWLSGCQAANNRGRFER